MTQILVQVKDQKKSNVLLELLKSLDFVDSVYTINKEVDTPIANEDDSLDFFSMAGIWEDREITLESIRQKAWRRR